MLIPEIEYVTNTPASYFIALSAWRRGLTVTFIKNINNYRITSTERSLFFTNSAMVGGKNGLLKYDICKDKFKTKHFLQESNIPTPDGRLFDQATSISQVISYAEQLEYPVVLKINNGSRGIDVFPNLNNHSEITRALESIRKNKSDFKILVENYIEGDDYKVYVIGDQAVAAYTRTPAKIIGDGKHSVKELIDKRNNLRSQNPHLKVSLLVIDEEVLDQLDKINLTLHTIVPKEKVVYLRASENVSVAGDLDDITSQLPEHLNKLAVNAIQAIPHLKNGSVDIRYSKDQCPEGSVLEINSMAQIAGHLFPSSGSPQDVASKMIDFYFPESIKTGDRNSEMFFNMKTIEKYFGVFAESDYTLAPAPVNETIRRRIVIQGVFKLSEMKYNIRNEARRLNLSGLIKQVSTEQIVIVISGGHEDIDLFADFLMDGIKAVTTIEIKNYNKQIVSGFSIGK